MRYLPFLVVLLLLAGCSAPVVTDHTLTADEGVKEYITDTPTPTYEFNSQVPGPLLEAQVGEEFSVRAVNNLEEDITVHWHGLEVPNVMDGVPDVTQKPIRPGEEFVYRFTPPSPGTYWYHSHVDAHKQVEMGLQGPFIVRDNRTLSHSETVLMLDDVAIDKNGQYRSFQPNYMHGRFGTTLLVNGMVYPDFRIAGTLHRLRLINSANARSFTLDFGGNVTVIGEDIGYVEPYETRFVTIHPGGRYDILVESAEDFTMWYRTSRSDYPLATFGVSPYQAEVEEHDLQVSELPADALNTPVTFDLSLQGVRDPQYGLVWEIGGHNSLSDPGTFTVTQGDLVRIQLRNTQGQPHPMHLHGQRFKIVKDDGTMSGWKDTVMIGGGEVKDIILVADEPGEWVFHCHILEHAKAGMLASLTVKPGA